MAPGCCSVIPEHLFFTILTTELTLKGGVHSKGQERKKSVYHYDNR